MIDWVMFPQMVVVLYIYRVGRSYPASNLFITRNSEGLLNSTRTRGLPVRPVWPLPDRHKTPHRSSLTDGVGPCAKFGCEQVASERGEATPAVQCTPAAGGRRTVTAADRWRASRRR
jgi:hypothetical protein